MNARASPSPPRRSSATGAYLLLHRDLVRVVLGVVRHLAGGGPDAHRLGARPAARRRSTRCPSGTVSDPLSQAMALTAIVIGLAVTALLLVLVLRVVARVRVARARRGRRGGSRARRARSSARDGREHEDEEAAAR